MNSILEENQREWERKKKERKSIWKSKTQLWVLRTWLMWMGMCAYASSAHALPHILLRTTLSINLVGSGFILTISLSLNATLDQILFSENTLYVSYANEMNWLTFHFFFSLDFSSFDKLINRFDLFKAYYHVKFGLMSFVILALLLLFDRIYQTPILYYFLPIKMRVSLNLIEDILRVLAFQRLSCSCHHRI